MYLKFSDGSKYKIPHPMMVAAHKSKYMTMDATFIGEDSVIHAPIIDTCNSCSEKFENRPVRTMFFSEDRELNKRLGRPGRVCAICYFRPYHEAGHTIPSPLIPYF